MRKIISEKPLHFTAIFATAAIFTILATIRRTGNMDEKLLRKLLAGVEKMIDEKLAKTEDSPAKIEAIKRQIIREVARR